MRKKNSRRTSKGFTLAELLVVIAIIGVLVAISVPIFTSQISKARLATNQANARAAYAVAVAKVLEDGGASAKISYTYKVADASCTGPADASTVTPNIDTPISGWDTNTASGVSTTKLGDDVADTWIVVINADGTLAGFNCTFAP